MSQAHSRLSGSSGRNPGDTRRLSASERRDRARLERTIKNGLEVFLAVGAALREVKERTLYRETHQSFDAYMRDLFAKSRGSGYGYLAALRVHENVQDVLAAVHPDEQVVLPYSTYRKLDALDQDLQRQIAPRLVGLAQAQVDEQLAPYRQGRRRRRPVLPEPADSAGRGELTILVGDALAHLDDLEDSSVACCVTSPPFYGQRDYSGIEGEIGSEETAEAYVDALATFGEKLWRVLRPDGVLWLHLGDLYGGGNPGPRRQIPHGDGRPFSPYAGRRVPVPTTANRSRRNGRPKDMFGIPWRVAFRLQEQGWLLRAEVIVEKSGVVYQNLRDRPEQTHERLFLFAKKPRYYFDADAIAVPTVDGEAIRSCGSVWQIKTVAYPGIHYATMPPELAARCIRSGSSAGGHCPGCGTPYARADDQSWRSSCACGAKAPVPSVVLDPFAGVGTTPLVALQLGRSAIAIELNPSYADEMRERIAEALPDQRIA